MENYIIFDTSIGSLNVGDQIINNSFNKKIIAIVMLLSKSCMEIIFSAITYGITFAKNLNKISKKAIMIILVIPIGAVYFKSESLNIFYNRTFVQQDSTEGRFGNFTEMFKK